MVSLLAESRTFFDVARLHAMPQWWHWLALVGVCLVIASYLVLLYRRDTVELPKGTRILLIVLRLTTFIGLLIFFLDIEKRTERKQTTPSRVAIMIDTSQSMGLSDESTEGSTAPESRLTGIVKELAGGSLLKDLRTKHDVSVYRFDQASTPEPIGLFPKDKSETSETTSSAETGWLKSRDEARTMYSVAGVILGFALLTFLMHWIFGPRLKGAEGESWALLIAGICLIVAMVVMAVTNLRNPTVSLAAAFGQDAPPIPSQPEETPSSAPAAPSDTIDWANQLRPRGAETQLGEAIRWVVEKERGGPMAGIVLMTDGRSNAGLDTTIAAELAQQANIPLYPIGAGSEKTPKSVRVVDLEAPARVFPGDKFTMTGYIQGNGLPGRSLKIELASVDAELPSDKEVVTDEQRITLGPDGEIQTISFEVTPSEVGRRRWTLRVVPPREDLDDTDNQKSANVEVVDRKNQVLLIAGGPTREYRFLRNLLYRDSNTMLHVLLQSSPPGAAQEANDVLLNFPETAEEMFAYDCVVAFDPDWRKLSNEQIQLLDRWVSEKAGGLIVVSGPVFTPQWTRSRQGANAEKLNTVKALYPVTFFSRSSASTFLGRTNSDAAWPIKFDEEGKRSAFLQLEDSAEASNQVWNEFEGIYGFQAIKSLKPGAKAYAYFSDPEAAIDEELPVYMAGQFYGSGRVFYLGSGEMWRLRSLDERFFETFYTKLIRHISQGRLMRDSSRGILLVDKERCSLGDTVTVRATLSDEQYRPLNIPTVEASLVHESGAREPLTLRQIPNAEREGTYTGQFTTTREGDYRIELPVPGVEDELLVQEIRVRLPAREVERPQRNDPLLGEIAKTTEGAYFVNLDTAMGRTTAAPLTNQISAKDQETFLPGTADRLFDERLMSWLLVLIAGALSLEWLIRRINKLA